MITQNNLSQLLDQIGFTQTGQKHSKTIGDATLIAAAPARKQAILERYL